jgi:hypothetical protein
MIDRAHGLPISKLLIPSEFAHHSDFKSPPIPK